MPWWQPLVYAALAGLVFAPLEWLWPERDEPGEPGAMRTDALFAGVGTLLTHVALALVMGVVLGFAAQIETFELPLDGPAATLVGLLIFELCGYAYHRAAHASPLLWRLHAVHHSAPRMSWLASFRQHPLEIVLMTLAQNLPLVLLGVPLGGHALIVTLLVLNTAFVHSNLRVDPPWLRELIATPRFHHRHHDRDAHPANFASLLPVIDRVFGSHARARAGRFGLDEAHPGSFWGLLVWPFRPARAGVVSGAHGHGRAAHLPAGHRSPAR
jgi:sterol desaturase/sphingolipid hydroxylase (fatty acid hydroxylase superfamily)